MLITDVYFVLNGSVYLNNSAVPLLARVYKEGEGEYRTAYILRVTAVRMVHDLCNDIHVWRSPWNVLECTSTTMVYSCVLVHAHVASQGCNFNELG